MRLKRLMKQYYDAKMGDGNVPGVPALNFLHSDRPVRKRDFRTEFLLNVFVHAVIALMLIFVLLPERRESEFSLILGKRAEELLINRNINDGLVTMSRYFKASLKSK